MKSNSNLVIKESLNILVQDLNEFLSAELGLNDPIVLSNIADEDIGQNQGQGQGTDQIYLTLVNIEEETTLKNTLLRNASLPAGDKQMPPMRLNLYLLISFKASDYNDALEAMGRVMGYCQSKKAWNQTNTVVPEFNGLTYENFLFYLDIYNISFEDSNNMWGNLGGKQLPFVIYKMRLVTLSESITQSSSGVITSVITNSNAE